jgi:hypothetical protein
MRPARLPVLRKKRCVTAAYHIYARVRVPCTQLVAFRVALGYPRVNAQ